MLHDGRVAYRLKYPRHDGTRADGRGHRGIGAETRSGAAGIAAVQRAELTCLDQATLLQRVWGVDALACGRCGGPVRFIAVIKDRAVIERILQQLGIAHDLPRFALACDPCAFAE